MHCYFLMQWMAVREKHASGCISMKEQQLIQTLSLSWQLAVFRAVVNWVEDDKDRRLSHLSRLMQSVRFALMRPEELQEVRYSTTTWTITHFVFFKAHNVHQLSSNRCRTVSCCSGVQEGNQRWKLWNISCMVIGEHRTANHEHRTRWITDSCRRINQQLKNSHYIKSIKRQN